MEGAGTGQLGDARLGLSSRSTQAPERTVTLFRKKRVSGWSASEAEERSPGEQIGDQDPGVSRSGQSPSSHCGNF